MYNDFDCNVRATKKVHLPRTDLDDFSFASWHKKYAMDLVKLLKYLPDHINHKKRLELSFQFLPEI